MAPERRRRQTIRKKGLFFRAELDTTDGWARLRLTPARPASFPFLTPSFADFDKSFEVPLVRTFQIGTRNYTEIDDQDDAVHHIRLFCGIHGLTTWWGVRHLPAYDNRAYLRFPRQIAREVKFLRNQTGYWGDPWIRL